MQVTPTGPVRISLRQYMENPTGKGTAFVAKRGLVRQGMIRKFVSADKTFSVSLNCQTGRS